jgi:Carbohydrate esterase, sialic acid-specific acetylesterase
MMTHTSTTSPHSTTLCTLLCTFFAFAASGSGFAEENANKARAWDNNPKGVQVFILAGQSNMVGHGKAEEGHGDVKGAIGSLRYQVDHDPKNYAQLVNKDGTWKTRDDVKVWWRDSDITAPRDVIKGDLKIGYSQSRNPGWIGPEYGFGWAVGEHFTQPVLIIKVAWGGKSLNVDFRPPSAAARSGVVGPYYTGMITYVHDVLDNLDTEFPEWKGMGYHIAGFGWHQGWNDRVDSEASANYEANLVDLIKDLRTEFASPKLPVSIVTTSMAPPPEPTAVELAQLAVADPKKYPAFKGNVKTTDARPFWRDASVSPSNFGYHWNHNGETEYLNGKTMGEKMVEMIAH